MNTTKKKIVIAIAIIIAIVGIGSFGYIQYQNQKQLAVDFLVEKYDFNRTDIEILDFEIEHYYIGYQDVFCDWYYIGRANNKWSIEYKGNQFYVNDFNGKLYDDYQLTAVAKWCTEWFKKNIDKRIICVKIDTISLIAYQDNCAKKANFHIFNENDIYDFIMSNSISPHYSYENNEWKNPYYAIIYFDANGMTENEIESTKNELHSIVKQKLKEIVFCEPEYTFNEPKTWCFPDGIRMVDCCDWAGNWGKVQK